MANSTCLGVIVGNRDFFPDVLISEARTRSDQAVLPSSSIEPVWLSPEESKLGAVETWADAQKCGELLRRNRDRIEGILVCLPNFGDEKGVADSIRLAETHVPVLVQACPDDLDQFGLDRRRDAFCGKISVCNNLRQYRIPVLAYARSHGGDSRSALPRGPGAVYRRPAGWCAA